MGNTALPGFTGSPTLSQASTSLNSAGFTGLSNYSKDLQNALNRSVALASLPLHILQNQQSQLASESSELSTLNTRLSALQTAIASLNSANQNLQSASVSDKQVLTATAGIGALPGTFTIQVIDPGSFAGVMSADGLPTVSDPASQSISSEAQFTLTVDGVSTSITPASNTLQALVAAINAEPAAGVRATLVNVGPPSAPDYRLSLQSTKFGNIDIQLDDGTSTTLLGTLTAGSLAQYQVNGQPSTPISSPSSLVTISPGVTVNLLQAGTSTVTVAASTTAISSALSGFASAYNSVVDELNNNIGQAGGALAGQSIVYTLQQTLSGLLHFTGTGAVTSPAAIGLTFDTTGHLNFDSSVLGGASESELDQIQSFLGNTSSGFVQFMTSQINTIEDPLSGVMANAMSVNSKTIANNNALISRQQDQINQLQTSLQAQMAKADSAIAALESRLSYFTSLFTAMIQPNSKQGV